MDHPLPNGFIHGLKHGGDSFILTTYIHWDFSNFLPTEKNISTGYKGVTNYLVTSTHYITGMILLAKISTGYNRPEWPYFIPAILGALIDGSAMPLCTVALVGSMEGPGPRDGIPWSGGRSVGVRYGVPKHTLPKQKTHQPTTTKVPTNEKVGLRYFLERFAWYLVPKVSKCSGCTFDCC